MTDPATPDHVTGAGLPAEATGERPGPFSVFLKVLSAALSGGLVVLLFAAIIPKVTEFESVGESIKSIAPATVVLMLITALAIRVVLAASYSVLTPGLSLWRSLVAREASSAVSNIIPGPSGTAAQFAILRSWGVGLERFARATVAVSVSTDVLIMAGPGLFFIGWTLVGQPAAEGGQHAWAFGIAAVFLSAVSILVVVAIASSVKLATRLGRWAQACVNPLRRLFNKPKLTTWPDQMVAMRADLVEELRRDGIRLLACVVGGYLLNGVLLVMCLWACGASRDELPLSLGLMLYGVGRIATIVQITPGGVGITEIAYTAVYTAVLGDSAQAAIVAGVLVYRMWTYLLPIITGAFAYVIWRVMRRRERRAGEAAEPVRATSSGPGGSDE
jgi:putative heme transporter